MRSSDQVRVAICPSSPALLPGATGRTTVPEIEQLRTHCRAAVEWLCAPGHEVLVVTAEQVPAPGTTLSMRAFGLPGELSFGADDAGEEPLAPHAPGLLVAAAFLHGHPARVIGAADPATATERAAPSAARAVLVMGSGSACRADGAPGHVDERAIPFDDALVRAIGDAELGGLAHPDLTLARELRADLPGPLSVAARLLDGLPLVGRVDLYSATWGVAQIVGRWWSP